MADGIKIGNLDISSFKVGSSDCKVYLGDTLLYPQGEPPTPPVFEGKYKLTLSDSSTVSAECDGTSAVTSGEVATQYSGTVVSAEIGQCVTSIDYMAFYSCASLTSVDIGSGITSIGGYAFNNCRSITSIVIPSGLTHISARSFRYCIGLTSVTILAITPPTSGKDVFTNTPIANGTGTIYVPSESVEAYKSATNWSTYADRIRAIPS